MAAAVADYVPQAVESKIKRSGSALNLTLEEGPDILRELGADRRERLLIGFAAETEALLESARGKLRRKNLDFIVANDVSRPGVGLDADDNEVTLIGRDGETRELPRASKVQIADAILDHVFGSRGA